MAVFSPRTKWSLYSITRTETNAPVLTLAASITQHPAVQYFTKIHIQTFYMITFTDQSLVFQRIQKSQLLNQTSISAKEPQVNDPVPHLDSSLFSSGVVGECLIFTGSCQNMMNASSRLALKTCINILSTITGTKFFFQKIQLCKMTAEAHARPVTRTRVLWNNILTLQRWRSHPILDAQMVVLWSF